MLDIILKSFEHPDEVREFEKGRFEIVNVGGMTIGRAIYQPGWNGRNTSARVPEKIFAMSNTWEW